MARTTVLFTSGTTLLIDGGALLALALPRPPLGVAVTTVELTAIGLLLLVALIAGGIGFWLLLTGVVAAGVRIGTREAATSGGRRVHDDTRA